jgi:hypothetical protein
MRRADIEVPSEAVDVNSWASPACYPRGSFCPVSHGHSTLYRGITKPDFRLCSARWPHSQAPLCLYTRWLVSIQPEGTFGRLRYSLGGDRPSQTACLARSGDRLTASVRTKTASGWYFTLPLHRAQRPSFIASHLAYADPALVQCQGAVKLHGVFLSCCGYMASSPRFQFRRVPR